MGRILQIVKNYFWHLPKAIFWNLFYGFPGKKINIIGVTGTDGKTTTATLIHHLLTSAGLRCQLVTTINGPGQHTTSPSPQIVQKLLHQYHQSGFDWIVLETTAHGLDQFRFWGCHFKIGIVTNIAHEHLDDFVNLNIYTQSKLALLKQSDQPIANADSSLLTPFIKSHPNTLTYGIDSPCQLKAANIRLSSNSLIFHVKNLVLKTDSPYRYQIYNILAALSVCRLLKIPDILFQNNIYHFPKVPGRRQIVPNPLGIKCIIDFAHTPQALLATLSSLRSTNHGQIILIFGATGGRDPSKRPLMGKVISSLADHVILTTDDLRHEKLSNINKQIIAGFVPHPNFSYEEAENRQLAFDIAISKAKKGDIVIACGKGHETTLLIGSTEYPWSELKAFELAIHRRQEKSNEA